MLEELEKEWKRLTVKPTTAKDCPENLYSEYSYPESEFELNDKKVWKFVLKAYEMGYLEAVNEIKTMKLWSKGNVEGTRQDIIHKLTTKLQEKKIYPGEIGTLYGMSVDGEADPEYPSFKQDLTNKLEDSK
jgi:hypothetical protein